MEKKKRPLTLAGSIVNIVFAAIDIIYMAIMLVTLDALTRSYGSVFGLAIAVCVFEILFATTIIILSSILIAKCSKPVAQYKKCSGLVITLFVFDCICVLSCLINLLSGNVGSIVMLLVYGMCGTFVLVDLCRNNKAYKKLDPNAVQTAQPAPQNAQVATPVYTAPATTSASEKLMKDLIDIKKMKDAGIIDEKEYEELKSKIIANAKF